jgi:hypothetical protein
VGLSGTATMTVPERTITITPATSKRGTVVTVVGQGYNRNGGVTINYAGAGVTGGTTDGSGGFTLNFTVPITAGLNSTNVVTAVDNSAGGLLNQNSVIHMVPGSTLTVTPSTVAIGSQVSITGDGFPQFTSLAALTIGGLNVLPASGVNTDAAGNFSVSVTVPAQNTGIAAVTATSGGSSGTANITVSAAAASVAAQMQPIATILVRVWAFDNVSKTWKLYDPNAPASANTLSVIAKGQAVNIVTSGNGTLTNAGGTYPLTTGNNIVGWQGP